MTLRSYDPRVEPSVSPRAAIRELERAAREAEAREDYARAAALRERIERIRARLESATAEAA